MRLKVVNKTTFTTGDDLVSASHDEARMTPCYAPNQSLLNPKVTIEPSAWRHDYFDYWDTQVVAFNVSEPHHEMVVTATTELDYAAPEMSIGYRFGWADLADENLRDRYAEFLQVDDDLVAAPGWQEWRDEASGPAQFTQQLMGRGLIDSHGEQIVHDALDILRWAGIPARFVSGYLMPAELEVGVASDAKVHAWLEYWDGAWCAWDPRLDCQPDGRHVVIGYARRGAGIPLICGIQNGASPASGRAEICVTRLT